MMRTWSTTSCNFLGTKGRAHSRVRAVWQRERSENVHKDNVPEGVSNNTSFLEHAVIQLITVCFLISLLLPVNCSYLDP